MIGSFRLDIAIASPSFASLFKAESIIFGGCWTNKSRLRICVWAPEVFAGIPLIVQSRQDFFSHCISPCSYLLSGNQPTLRRVELETMMWSKFGEIQFHLLAADMPQLGLLHQLIHGNPFIQTKVFLFIQKIEVSFIHPMFVQKQHSQTQRGTFTI